MNGNRHISRFGAVSGVSAKGFTLVEVLVVMVIFIIVIIITSQAFNKILTVSNQQTKSAESDTQGVIGLEMLRVDLEHAGYGLPWTASFVTNFDESQVDPDYLAPGISPQNFNDKYLQSLWGVSSDPNMLPRAIQAAASTTDGRDYLVIKSVPAGMSDTTKKWSYVEGLDATSTIKSWGSNNLASLERVITIDSRTKRLVGAGTTNFSYIMDTDTGGMTPLPAPTPPVGFRPQQDTDVFVVYGVSPASSTAALRAPYNRVDYYIKRPAEAASMPSRCAPGTGILYKGVMVHGTTGGGVTQYPLVECIADMQVVFKLDIDGTGGHFVGAETIASGLNEITLLSAKEIRQQLKEIIVYVVAHEGGKDTGFSYASPTLLVGEGYGRTLDLNALVGPDYKYYRWKTYKLAVAPKNINY